MDAAELTGVEHFNTLNSLHEPLDPISSGMVFATVSLMMIRLGLLIIFLFSSMITNADHSPPSVSALERNLLSTLCVNEHAGLPVGRTMQGCLTAINYVVDHLEAIQDGRLTRQSLDQHCEQNVTGRRRLRGCRSGLMVSLEYFGVTPSRPNRFDRPLNVPERTLIVQRCRQAIGTIGISFGANGCAIGMTHAFENHRQIKKGRLSLANLESYCTKTYSHQARVRGCLQGLITTLEYLEISPPPAEGAEDTDSGASADSISM
jgi:hypothetical protein